MSLYIILHAGCESADLMHSVLCVSRMLLSIDRCQTVSEAADTVLLAEKYSNSLHTDVKVVGVDLSGNPQARTTTRVPIFFFICMQID